MAVAGILHPILIMSMAKPLHSTAERNPLGMLIEADNLPPEVPVPDPQLSREMA